MAGNTDKSRIVCVSQKGQVLIPKELREKLGIGTPGEVFVHEEREDIIIEPVPSPSELHGIHTGENERGDTLERMRERKNRKKSGTRARRPSPSV